MLIGITKLLVIIVHSYAGQNIDSGNEYSSIETLNLSKSIGYF